MNKEILRREYIDIRRNIENKEEKSLKIAKKLFDLEEYKNAKTIAVYCSMEYEVDTKEIANYSFKFNKKVCFPKITEKTKLEFYEVKSLKELTEISSLRIKEPSMSSEKFVQKEALDLIVIPGICFDKYKNRIGFGKGYYDRFLENMRDTVKVGICFDSQLTKEKIEIDINDIAMDIIISESRIIK